MRSSLLIIAVIFSFYYNSQGQIKATTEFGDEVMLYHDHTWSYLSEKEIEQAGTPDRNKKKFSKSSSSDFLLKSVKENFGVWLNKGKWDYQPSTINSFAEYQFKHNAYEIYALMISEEVEVPLLSLRDIALENAKAATTKFKLAEQELREVNGREVVMLQMNGVVQNLNISYLGYYYTNENGSVQLLTYCSSNLFKKRRAEMEEFLNGLIALED